MIELDLTGKRMLIVGASSGIGRWIATSAGQAGARTVVVGRRESLLAEVAAAAGGHAVVADVEDPAQCISLVDDAVAVLGGLDAVVYAAGISPLTPLDRCDGDAWAQVLSVNTTAPSLITRAALASLAPGGIVAYLSSIAAESPHHGIGAYGASKAALNATIEAWQLEHPEYRFVRIAVGDTLGTDFAREFDPALAAELFPLWVSHAAVWATQMQADDLGRAISETIGILFAHPAITLPVLSFIPPGGLMVGGAAGLVEGIAEMQESL